MYLDVERISECLDEGFTERERADRIDELIKAELRSRGVDNFKEFSKTAFLFGDVYLFLASMILCVLALEKYGFSRTAYPELMFWGAVAIKEILSVLDTLVHYHGTSHGARFTALEATQFFNVLLLDSKLNNTKLVHLNPKKPRV